MKNKLFIIAVASLGLASCASDEVTSALQDDATIEFRTGMASRATETVKTTLNNGFRVIALSGETSATKSTDNLEFSDVFKKESATEIWKSTTKHYWPKHRLNFYAFYPYDITLYETASATVSNTPNLVYSGYKTPHIQNFYPQEDPKSQVDFVYATNGGLRSSFVNVPLAFQHALTQIVIKAKNGNTGYNIEVAGVRVGYVNKRGEFTFPEGVTGSTDGVGTWDLSKSTSDIGSYQSIFETNTYKLGTSTTDIADAEKCSFMILPQDVTKWNPDEDTDGTYLALLVKITGTGNTAEYAKDELIYPKYKNNSGKSGFGWAAVAISANWEAGKKYIYTLDFTDGAGKVVPDKGDGEDGGDKNPDPDGGEQPGDDILNHEIAFTVTVSGWTEIVNKGSQMDEAIEETGTANQAPAVAEDEE